MNRLIYVGLSLLITTIVVSCSNGSRERAVNPKDTSTDHYKKRAEALQSANVEKDVNAALEKGDRRFLCITGEGVFAPGLSQSEFTAGIGEEKVDKTRFYIIDNTYDDINPAYADSILQFKKTAQAYARKYNLLLTQKLARE